MSNFKYTNSPKDSEKYALGYEVFLHRTDFRFVVINNFKNLLQANLGNYSNLESIRILDIGCGNGVMTEKYLLALTESFPGIRIELDLVEPAEGAIEEARKRFDKLGYPIKTYNQNGEEFANFLAESDIFYDLILASYVFYHISTDIIETLTQHLSEFGSLLITMGSHEHPLRKHPALRKASKHGDSDIVEEAFKHFKASKDFNISKSTLKTNLNLNSLMDKESHFNNEGKAFFSFIYNTDLDNFSTDQIEALIQTVNEALNNTHGTVHPVHNMYWVSRNVP